MWMGLWQVQLKVQWRRDGRLVGAFVGSIASVGSCACCGCCCLTSQSILVDTIEVNQPEANQGCCDKCVNQPCAVGEASVQCGDVSVGNWKVAKQGFQLELAWLAAARMANRKV